MTSKLSYKLINSSSSNDDYSKNVSNLQSKRQLESNLYKKRLNPTELRISSDKKDMDEGLTNLNSSTNNENNYKLKKFNDVLQNYIKSSQLLNEEHIRLAERKIYSNKTIQDHNGNYYYINNYGIKQKFSTKAWNNKDKSCLNLEQLNVSPEILAQLPNGASINTTHPCKLAGNIIRNKNTLEEAWIDIKGFKHILSKEKNVSCDKSVIDLDSLLYNAYKTGEPFTKISDCNIKLEDPVLSKNVNRLHKELIDLANEMNINLDEYIDKYSAASDTNLDNEQNLLMSDLHTSRSDYDMNIDKMNTITGRLRSSNEILTANYYHYLVWIILTITILYLLFYIYFLEENHIFNILILIFLLIVVYRVAIWVGRRYALI